MPSWLLSAVRTPDAAAAAEHSQLSDDSWRILGIATATEHSALIDAATATEHSQLSGNIGSDGPGHRVVSIGSVKIRHDASNEPATRVMELVQHEIHLRLHLYISNDEIRDYCSRSATEQTDTSVCGRIRDLYYNKHSWSGTIEAISRCVAAYQRAADALEISACESIMNKLKRHVQALLQKCVPNTYVRQIVMDIITDYIWNRSCNVALHMLLDDILTSEERPKELSQQEFNYALDLLEACAGCLRTSGDEILAELSHYRRSATEQTDTQHPYSNTACRNSSRQKARAVRQSRSMHSETSCETLRNGCKSLPHSSLITETRPNIRERERSVEHP